MLRPKHMLIFVLLFFLVVSSGFAQNRSKIKQQTPTVTGSTGLFNLPTADSLRRGEFSFSLAGTEFNREPGDLDITLFPVSFTVGLHDRIEMFASYEIYKRVHNDGLRVNRADAYRFVPGLTFVPLSPAQLASGERISYYNDTPFMDLGFGDGPGDLRLGFKFNLLSERRGDGVGLAIQPRFKFAVDADPTDRRQGLSPGLNDYGFDLIFSKDAGASTFTLTGGLTFAEDSAVLERQDSINYGLGIDIPLGTKKVHFIGELLGSIFYGDRDTGFVDVRRNFAGALVSIPTTVRANPRSPADAYGGLRFFPARWVAVGAAYNYYINRRAAMPGRTITDRHGWLAQVVFQRKINRPPTADCSIDSPTVIESNTVGLSADVFDSDDDVLTVTWRSSVGRLTPQDTSATFDSTGVSPGNYTIMAEVSDGEATASCSVDVTVEKNKKPPTINCQPSTVQITEGESTTLTAQASDPNGDALTYSWTVDGQSVTNNSPTFEFGSAGRSIGNHTVTVTVTDVDGMSASCSFTVTINRRPNSNPTVSLSLNPTQVNACEQTVTATATASDPDGDPLTYSWTVDGQPHPGTGPSITIDTCGMAGGNHTVTVTVRDDRGGSASDTKSFAVREVITIQVDRRLDNIAKAQLDEIALKLQQNPELRAKATGHTDDRGSEQANERVGLRRANLVKDYLVKEHNIDPARIEALSAGESQPAADNSTAEGRKQNRRVVVELYVP